MEQAKLLEILSINPNAIAHIAQPTDEMKLLAVRKNGLTLQCVESPSREMQMAAIENNARAIQFVADPTPEMMTKAIMDGWINLEYIKNPPDDLLKLAVSQAGWAIKYAPDPSEDLQLLAVGKNYDAIRFIANPSETVQQAAVSQSYEALRYIKAPSPETEKLAIRQNEQAIRLVNDLDKAKLLMLMKENILVLNYVLHQLDVSLPELEQVLRQVLSDEATPEKYVRDFLNCSCIDKHSERFPLDKLMFLYRYGSRQAKRIAIDEKLKRPIVK